MAEALIQSAGDSEIVLLHEVHETLASIVGPHLYTVLGDAPNQEVRFANERCFDLFLIHLVELFAEGHNVIAIEGRNRNLSLVEGLEWLDQNRQDETRICGLSAALGALTNWLGTETDLEVWCPDIEEEIRFPVTRRELIWFGANHAKHNLLRLSVVLRKLARKLEMANVEIPHQHVLHVLEVTIEEVRRRLIHHSTFIIELLGDLFTSLNRLIIDRHAANPTNRVDEMVMPEGVTSDVFRDLYGRVLVFKRYDEEARIRAFVPTTNPALRLRD